MSVREFIWADGETVTYRSEIKHNGRRIWVGTFPTREAANQAEVDKRAKLGPEDPKPPRQRPLDREPGHRIDNRRVILPDIPVPACFDSPAQFQYWQECSVATNANAWLKGQDFCTDCTPEYQRKMLKAGRCAWPETFFVLRRMRTEDIDGELAFELCGVNSQLLRKKYDNQLSYAKRVRMLVTSSDQIPAMKRAWIQRSERSA